MAGAGEATVWLELAGVAISSNVGAHRGPLARYGHQLREGGPADVAAELARKLGLTLQLVS